MFPNLFHAAFREQRLGLMLTVLVAVLVYLASLAFAAQGALATATQGFSRSAQSRLTIEVPVPEETAKTTKEERLKSVVDALHTFPEVTSTSILSNNEVVRLLKPWFSNADVVASLPLPTLIDVDANAPSEPTMNHIKDKLKEISQDIRVQSRAEGMDSVLRLINSLRLLAALMIGLTMLTLVIAISLICRAAMAVHHDMVELLHFMGATDKVIVKQFMHPTLRFAAPAALGGFACALITTVGLAYLARAFWGAPIIAASSWALPGALTALVPVAAIAVALMTVRISILSSLKRMP